MMENNNTLEELQKNYISLKNSLEKQEIVNDKLMREVMDSRIRSIFNLQNIGVFAALFVIIVAPLAFHYNPAVNASWYFVVGTELLMMFCLYKSWDYAHEVRSTDMSSCDLLSFSKKLKKMKRKYQDWIKWGFLLCSAWVIWLCEEVWRNSNNPKGSIAFIVGVLFGIAAGGYIGYRLDKKIIAHCDDIISQCES